ncbi:MAG: lyase family protein [Sutterellaceae bacterium]|nr:lyase family protein [Sutterellaceae bacterium]MDD7441756.1 lyase family protein [Sutterellaceae bacterium]MDY2868544.1 lyase family protein [Mesosutterella sp.]
MTIMTTLEGKKAAAGKNPLWGKETERFIAALSAGGPALDEYPEVIRALALVKKAAALANEDIGRLGEGKARAICAAADEAVAGKLRGNFPVGALGSWGVPANTMMNEVLAARASELSGLDVRPEDVNRSQGSIDVVRTAERIVRHDALLRVAKEAERFAEKLDAKATEFADVVKPGRALLRDGFPVTLGAEFEGYAVGIRRTAGKLELEAGHEDDSALGFGDFGNGFGIPAEFRGAAAKRLTEVTGRLFRPALSGFDAIAATDRALLSHAHIQALALVFWRACCDLTLITSGPRGGIREIAFPAVAPGSSIMPGKVNPTMAQLGKLVADQVSASQLAITKAVQSGFLDTGSASALPTIRIAENADLLSRTLDAVGRRVVDGLKAFRDRDLELAKASPALKYAVEAGLVSREEAEKALRSPLEEGAE